MKPEKKSHNHKSRAKHATKQEKKRIKLEEKEANEREAELNPPTPPTKLKIIIEDEINKTKCRVRDG